MLHGDQSAARIGAGRAGLSTFLPPMIAVKSMQQEIFPIPQRAGRGRRRAGERSTDRPCTGARRPVRGTGNPAPSPSRELPLTSAASLSLSLSRSVEFRAGRGLAPRPTSPRAPPIRDGEKREMEPSLLVAYLSFPEIRRRRPLISFPPPRPLSTAIFLTGNIYLFPPHDQPNLYRSIHRSNHSSTAQNNLASCWLLLLH